MLYLKEKKFNLKPVLIFINIPVLKLVTHNSLNNYAFKAKILLT